VAAGEALGVASVTLSVFFWQQEKLANAEITKQRHFPPSNFFCTSKALVIFLEVRKRQSESG
jgi:hypothetical protein